MGRRDVAHIDGELGKEICNFADLNALVCHSLYLGRYREAMRLAKLTGLESR